MLLTTDKSRVEAQYGRAITDAEYEKALQYATMKLEAQSRILGRTFDSDYLTIVVAEQVNQQRLDAYYEDVIECIKIFREMAKEQDDLGEKCGLQDGNPGDRGESDARTSALHPYYSTVPTALQYMGV